MQKLRPREQLRRLMNYALKGVRNGFLHIFVGSTMVKIVSALSVLLIPNLMSKQQFGALSLPDNIISYVLLFNGLGISTAVLRYCAVFDDPAQKKAYFRFSVRFGLLADIVLIAIAYGFIGLAGYIGHYSISPLERNLLLSLAFTPFLAFLFDAIQNYLRATRRNKAYSRVSIIYTVGYAVFQILFVLLFKVYGMPVGRYFGYAVAVVAAIAMLRSIPSYRCRAVKLRRNEKSGMIRYGANQMLSNLFSQIMPLVETTIVNYYVIDSSLRGEFKVAWSLPSSLQYVTLSIVVFVFPYYAKHFRDGEWIRRSSKRLYLSLAGGMAVILPLAIFATPGILHLFFPKYYSAETVHLMRMFWIAFGINAAFKMTTGNILAALGEVRFNLVVTFFSSIIQGLLCWALVSRYGVYGAAYGLVISYAVYSIAGIFYLRYYCSKLTRQQREYLAEDETEDDEL